MSSTTYLPRLNDYIRVSELPDEFNFVTQPIDTLFSHIYLSQVQVSKSQNFTVVNYSIVLRSYKKLGIEIPGTGLELILNPDFDPNTNDYFSEFPISLDYDFPIKKIIEDFNWSSFSSNPQDFFFLIRDFFGITEEETILNAVNTFKAGNIGSFIADINTHYGLTSNPLLIQLTGDIKTDSGALVYAIYGHADLIQQNANPFSIVLALFINPLSNTTISFDKINEFFDNYSGKKIIEHIKEQLIPKISAELFLSAGLEVPRSVLTPLQADPNNPGAFIPVPAPAKTLLLFNAGTFYFSTDSGIGFNKDLSLSLIPQFSKIGNTSLTISFTEAKLDLSRKKNIAEADADGRPNDFVGIYIGEAAIGFPMFWNHDSTNSTAVIKGRNLLIGTGGLSGRISLESALPNGTALFRFGDANNSGKHFQLGFTQFAMEFKQNTIIGSDIRGYMRIPGFKDVIGNDAQIDIWAHIGNNGDFRITASEQDGIVWGIPNAFNLIIKSLSVGKENDRWYIEASGSLQITANIPGAAGDFLKQPLEIKKLRIWQDGSIEFLGGGITLPTQVHLRIGPVSLALNHLSFGSHEGVYQNVNRQYFYFGFNGELNTGAGGVAVRGDGVEFHFTRDAGTFHSYLRIAGIGVDIRIPGNASPESADILINGYLAMRNGPDASGVVQTAGPEYQGAVSFKLRPLRISGKGAMAMRPKVPAYIVDIELELSVPITLGATGLGIYGFRGLIGSHYVASRPHIGLTDQDTWYEYLKKKMPPENRQGVYISKFDPDKKGFSLGVGATVGTMGDDGWTFSSKVFVLLSMPEMLLIEGQANVLHKRLGIESESDPPFYAFLVLDNNSVQAGIGVNYKLPDSGSILSVRGEMQLAYFFNNSSAWYVNIGRDMPEEKRLQARLLTLFNAYAYLMISSKGIKVGAGARFDIQKKFGPARVGLYAFIDTRGFISFKPIQLGGAIQLGGGVYIRVGRFGIEIHVAAGLSVEAPVPFVIEGYIQLKIKIFIFKIKIKFSLTWSFNKQANTDEVMLLDPGDFSNLPGGVAAQYPFKAINMLSEESFALKYLGHSLAGINPVSDSTWNNYIIPMDSYIDVEFKRPVKPFTDRYGGGINPLPQFVEYVAPQKGRMPQVKHSFIVQNIELMIWNKTSNTWTPYDPWLALTRAFVTAGLTVNTSTFNFGNWQYNNTPGKYTSLRLLSQTPFSVSTGTPPEQLGMLSHHLFCQTEPRGKTCQYWYDEDPATIYAAGDILLDRNLLLHFSKDGSIGNMFNSFGIDPSLKIQAGSSFEIILKEPMPVVDLRLTSMNGARISYYTKVFTGQDTLSGLPAYEYQLRQQVDYYWQELMQVITYQDEGNPVAKIIIEAPECNQPVAYESFLMFWWELYTLWRGDNGSLPARQREQIEIWLSIYGNALQGEYDITGLVALCQAWNELLENHLLLPAEEAIVTDWKNNYCGQAEANNALDNFAAEVENIIANPEGYSTTFYAYVFNWREKYLQPLSLGDVDYCSLYIHEVCWQTLEDWEFNILVQQYPQSVITTGINSLSQSINTALPPVWRPDSSFAIVITTKDDVHAGGSTNVTDNNYPFTRTFAVGFKTAGTLGFFHKTQQEFIDLQQQNKADQYKLSGLRHYIDYQRSYPNADGKLTGAKPLYYKNPKLGLFFSKSYVYEFFTKWDSYNGNPAKEYQLLSVIRDPVDKPGDPPVIPAQVIGWQLRMGQQSIPLAQADVQTLSNLLTFGNTTCLSIVNLLNPPTLNAEVERPEIKPQKLYTAIFKSVEVITAGNQESIVHSYTFESSRYGDFEEHINSYIRSMTNAETGEQVLTNAFFPLPLQKTTAQWSAANTKLQQIISNTLPESDVLIRDYASVYDRIITGVLQLQALQAATGTEFNIIKAVNTTTGITTILGILVKSTEPFNDPKLPSAQMATTLSVTDQSNGNTQFTYVFSNDNSAIFITNAALSLPLHLFHIAFKLVRYNGVTWSIEKTVTVPVNLNAI